MRRNLCMILCLVAACTGLRAAPVTGVLTDLKAKPLDGVRVYSFFMRCSDGKPVPPKEEISTTTDSEGRYSLGELSPLSGDDYRYIVAYQPGKHIGWTMQCSDMGKMERFIGQPRPLMAAPAVSIKGRVLGEKDGPSASTKVKYLGLQVKQEYPLFLPGAILEMLHIPVDLTTCSDGTFTLNDVASDSYALVVPNKNGFAAQNTYIDASNLKIVLVRAGKIEGKVLDENGKPIKGVSMSAFQQGLSCDSTFTDAQGRFVLSDLSPGKWVVSACAPGRIFALVNDVTVTAAKTTGVPAISALLTAPVSGRVVRADDGRPVEGVLINVNPSGLPVWSGDSTSKTDANGAFKTIAPTGESYLAVYDLPVGLVAESFSYPITVPQSGISDVVVKLVKAELGKGVVLDKKGNPVPNATVTFFMDSVESVLTGVDGAFSISLPRPDPEREYSPFGSGPLALCVEQEDKKLGVIKLASRDDLLQGKVKVLVEPVESIKVHVKLPSGKPAKGAKINKVTVLTVQNGLSSFSGTSELRTDSQGNAVVDELLHGVNYDISASLPGYFDTEERPSIVPGATLNDVIDITLHPANRVQKGKVIDHNGKPVAGVKVSAEGKNMEPFTSTVTDASGRFTLHGLPDSSIRLSAEKNHSYGSMTVNKKSGSIVLQVVPMDF